MKREQKMMKNATIILSAAIGFALLGGIAQTASANLLTNGDFETAGTGGSATAAGWTFDPEPGIAPTTVTRDTNNPESGSYDLHLVVTGSSTAAGPAANALSQFDPAGPATIVPGDTYTATFYTAGTFGPGAVLNTFFDFYDASGNFLTRNLVEGGYATGSTAYTLHTLSGAAPANAAYFDIFFNFVTGAFDGASGDISVDNVTFTGPNDTSTPEPASLSVLGLGIAALVSRRRR